MSLKSTSGVAIESIHSAAGPKMVENASALKTLRVDFDALVRQSVLPGTVQGAARGVGANVPQRIHSHICRSPSCHTEAETGALQILESIEH
jgi:hypothetical protein